MKLIGAAQALHPRPGEGLSTAGGGGQSVDLPRGVSEGLPEDPEQEEARHGASVLM